MTTVEKLWVVAAFLVIFALLGALFWVMVESVGEPYQARLPVAPFTSAPVQYRVWQAEQWSAWQGAPPPKSCPFNLQAERLELRLRPGLEGVPLSVLNSDGVFGPLTNSAVKINRLTDRILITGQGGVNVWAEIATNASASSDAPYFCRLVLQK